MAAVLVHFSYEKFRLRSSASQMIWVPEDKSDFGSQAAKSKRRTLGAVGLSPPSLLVRDATGCGHQVYYMMPIINRS
jgi:hypothetical protein